jgi:hypothetical protein
MAVVRVIVGMIVIGAIIVTVVAVSLPPVAMPVVIMVMAVSPVFVVMAGILIVSGSVSLNLDDLRLPRIEWAGKGKR